MAHEYAYTTFRFSLFLPKYSSFQKNRNDAKSHYNFHLNRKIHLKIIIVRLVWTIINTLILIRTSHMVSVSLEYPNHWICQICPFFGKLAIALIFLHLPNQYWSFSKSAWWDDSIEYKNSYVCPKICHFQYMESFHNF